MSESEGNKDFVPLQKEGESDFNTAKPTEVSGGDDSGSSGQQGDSGETTQSRDDVQYEDNQAKPGEKQGYPLPSEMAEQEREQEQQSEQQQSSGEQKQESSSEEKKEESSGGDSEEKKEGEGGEKKRGDKVGASRENPDSIPTAGGEQLGQKHWGESEIVPDVPKVKEEDKVSSGDGQPDQQTADNTAKNAGGDGGEDGEEPKKGTIEKLKDKLGLNKDKE